MKEETLRTRARAHTHIIEVPLHLIGFPSPSFVAVGAINSKTKDGFSLWLCNAEVVQFRNLTWSKYEK
jgi:hypothetical protein